MSPNIGTITNYKWSVAGNVIGGWTASAGNDFVNPQIYALTNKTNQTITFYVVEEAQNLKVKCIATVNGIEWSAETTFEVRKPSLGLNAQVTGVIAVDANHSGGLSLHFGDNRTNGNQNGIIFTIPAASVDLKGFPTTNWMSRVGFLQEGSSFLHWQHTNGLECVTEKGSGLDNAQTPHYLYPYSWDGYQTNAGGTITTNQVAGDSPALPASLLMSRATFGHNLRMHAVFQAFAPSIPIGLKRIEWNWSITATNGASGLSSVYPTNLSAINETWIPLWTNNIQLRLVTTNNAPCP